MKLVRVSKQICKPPLPLQMMLQMSKNMSDQKVLRKILFFIAKYEKDILIIKTNREDSHETQKQENKQKLSTLHNLKNSFQEKLASISSEIKNNIREIALTNDKISSNQNLITEKQKEAVFWEENCSSFEAKLSNHQTQLKGITEQLMDLVDSIR